MPTDNTNPGNFANRSTEEVKNIASKGGQSSHSGGFASMDSDKQVVYFDSILELTLNSQLLI
jgi:general stress protein YciG